MAKYLPFIVSALIGVATWVAIGYWSGIEDAWDSPLYWKVGLPVMAVSILLIAIVYPVKPWRWGVSAAAAQAAVGFVQAFPHVNLWPLSLVVFGFISLPLIGSAYLGALVRKQSNGR